MRADDRIRVRRLLFEAYLAALDAERAGQKLTEARLVAAEIEMDELEDELRIDEGRLLAASGHWAEAAQAFHEAFEAAQRLGHPVLVPVASAHHFRAAARGGFDPGPPLEVEIEQAPTRALVAYLLTDGEAHRHPSSVTASRLAEVGELAAGLGYVTLERAAFQRAAEVWSAIGNEDARDLAMLRAARAMAALEASLPPDLREGFIAHPRNQALRGLVHA